MSPKFFVSMPSYSYLMKKKKRWSSYSAPSWDYNAFIMAGSLRAINGIQSEWFKVTLPVRPSVRIWLVHSSLPPASWLYSAGRVISLSTWLQHDHTVSCLSVFPIGQPRRMDPIHRIFRSFGEKELEIIITYLRFVYLLQFRVLYTADDDAEKLDLSHIAVEWYSHSGKHLVVSWKLNTHLPYNPAIVLLGIYSRETKTYVHIKTHMLLFIAALLVIVNSVLTNKQNVSY